MEDKERTLLAGGLSRAKDWKETRIDRQELKKRQRKKA